MKIYISSAISSCLNTYKFEFNKIQKKLEKKHIVINPATLPVGLDFDKYMPICLSMIDSADAILLFGNWQSSKGALLEKAYAEYQGKEVLFIDSSNCNA